MPLENSNAEQQGNISRVLSTQVVQDFQRHVVISDNTYIITTV